MNFEMTMDPVLDIPFIARPDAMQKTSIPLLSFIQQHHTAIIAQLNHYGAIVFRGFACEDAEYFSRAIALCRLGRRCDTSDYELPRTVFANDIYTSSDLAAHIPLPLHHEKPRSKKPPNHIYFCCVTPADKDGGTILANAEAIWRDMPHPIQERIIQHGVVYKQFFHGNTLKYSLLKKILQKNSLRRWSEYFGNTDKSFIEDKLKKTGAEWRWAGNDLLISNKLPGALAHPLTGNISWFNSAAYLNYYSNLLYGELNTLPTRPYLAARLLILGDMFPMICHYGNGQAFSAGEIADINRIIQHHSRIMHWQKGDFMIVDNMTFMHGKQPHQGKRLLYSCMTETTTATSND